LSYNNVNKTATQHKQLFVDAVRYDIILHFYTTTRCIYSVGPLYKSQAHKQIIVSSKQLRYRALQCSVLAGFAILCHANLVRHFRVLQFHALQIPSNWSIIFRSCIFMPCTLVRQFHVLQC